MIISIASGKGGTGKTTLSTSLALCLKNSVQFLDCDVEEPNAHLFLKPVIEKTIPVSISTPEIDPAKCDFCGKCAKVCAYNAIAVMRPSGGRKGNALVFPVLCHGCGSCAYFCPQGAIKEVPREIGSLELGRSGELEFIDGRLNIGEAMAPPVIRKIKDLINPEKRVIIDTPPGTSCPVVEAIKGSDVCVLVTEPTPFGLNDLILAVEVLRKMEIPFGVVINRSDLGDDRTEHYCRREDISILMRMPFKKEIAKAYSKGEALIQAFPEYSKDLTRLFNSIKELA